MGYCSTLHAVVSPADYIPLRAAIETYKLQSCFKFLNYNPDVDDLMPELIMMQSTRSLKWYETYPEVQDINKIFLDSQVSCLMRIGEEFPDVAYYSGNSSLQYLFNPSVTVNIDPDMYSDYLDEIED